MARRARIEARLRELLVQAPAEYVAVYLFGGRALGRARADSDVDLGFWRRAPSLATLDDQPYLYAEELGRERGERGDLVELNKAGPD